MKEYRLGIDLGGTGFQIGLVDSDFRIVAHADAPTRQHELSFEEVVANIAEECKKLLSANGLTPADVSCIGIGTPGCVDSDGLLRFAGNFSWHNVPLKAEMEKQLNVPVRIGNDANCAIIGETLAGAAKGRKNVLLLTLGTGVGGGLVINNKLFTGGHGMGAELGHVPFITGGVHCTCGIDGCFEAYASVTALIRMTKEAMAAHPESTMHAHAAANDGKVNGKTVYDCAHDGDPAALSVTAQYTENIAAGIGGFVNVFRPEIVLIGGGISAQGDYLLDPINEKLPKYCFAPNAVPYPKVVAATLGNAAGIIGAACMDIME
ncbi:MAG: ROK family protein [Clostridia bacterium]|nr:ROK family protein [Clostridia bacterium]